MSMKSFVFRWSVVGVAMSLVVWVLGVDKFGFEFGSGKSIALLLYAIVVLATYLAISFGLFYALTRTKLLKSIWNNRLMQQRVVFFIVLCGVLPLMSVLLKSVGRTYLYGLNPSSYAYANFNDSLIALPFLVLVLSMIVAVVEIVFQFVRKAHLKRRATYGVFLSAVGGLMWIVYSNDLSEMSFGAWHQWLAAAKGNEGISENTPVYVAVPKDLRGPRSMRTLLTLLEQFEPKAVGLINPWYIELWDSTIVPQRLRRKPSSEGTLGNWINPS